jgi:hypothetical protein
MKLLASTAGKHTLVLSVLLLGPVLTLHAQENAGLNDQPNLQSHTIQIVKTTSPQAALVLATTAKRETTSSEPNSDGETATLRIGAKAVDHWTWVTRESAVPAQTASKQGTTNNGYVFPTSEQRFHTYLWDTFGPLSLIGIGAAAGYDQSQNDPPEWKQGASGYGKRYASRLGQYAIEQTVTYGLSEAFKLDSGFHKSTRSGFSGRLSDALIQNITSRTERGKRVLSAPRLAGAYVGGIIPAVTWYPERYGYKDGLRAGTYSLAVGFGINVLREFIFRR